jgi:hypothetical protein
MVFVQKVLQSFYGQAVMPVFDFQCSACGLIFEALVKKNEGSL